MANGLNRVVLVGNLGMDPELKFLQGGQAVLRLRLAVTESFAGKDGQRQERTEWVNISVWGKRAEGLNKILEKGKTIWVEGRLQTRSWEQDGQKRYATEINASDIGLVGGGGRSGSQQREEHSGGGDFGGDDDGSELPF